MKKRSIKLKITAWFSIFFLILLAATLLVIFLVSRFALKTNTKERLKTLVQANLDEVEYLIEDTPTEYEKGDYYVPFHDGVLEIDDDFITKYDGVSMILYKDNTPLFGENPIKISVEEYPRCEENIQTISYEGEHYYIYDISFKTDELSSLWIRGMVNTNEGITWLHILVEFSLLGIPILAIFVTLGGYLIAKRMLEPLDEISNQAELISNGSDLTKRIQIKRESEETTRLIETFNQMFHRLHDSFESEKQFTSDASHELRTPIAVISAECEYALGETNANEWLESLSVIDRQNKKMASLVEELLAFTRIERNTIGIRLEELSLSALAREVCEEFKAIMNLSILLTEELAEDSKTKIFADRTLLTRMIRNLLENAYKYNKENGEIKVTVSPNEQGILLSIKDTGIGIPDDELPKIWNRFYRCDNGRNVTESTGLGLSMVKEIAKIHHAMIQVESKLGIGTEFLIYFS